ncbi:MAG: bifunctional 3'-5' exonuclease/DNA polymerase, partial [bacterium]|nr:bifunctional 3'-5' exonuclease/DNA polymerase [bacterium]
MQYKSVTTIKEIHEYLDGATVIAFDFETAPSDNYRGEERAALDAHRSDIAGISLSVAEGTAIYVPLTHRSGKNADDPKAVLDYLTALVFQNPQVIKVAHNLSFEAMFLYAKGIVILPPVYDTIAASQMTLKSGTQFRQLSDSGLKTLVLALFDVEMPSFTTLTAGRSFDELSPQDKETIHYACADADYTFRLYHQFNGWFDRYLPKHRFVVEKIESPTAIFVGLMKYNGLLMDKDLMLKKQAEADERLAKLKEEIAFIIGDVNIGMNASTSAFKNYLFKDLGLPVLKTTAKYQEAADEEVMILLAEWCTANKPELV